MSRRTTLMFALVLSSLVSPLGRAARAQSEPMTATILRRTAVRVGPSAGASMIAFVNPGTFEITQARLQSGFVRLLLSQIDPRRPVGGFGFVAAADVAVDSATSPAPPSPTAAARPSPTASARPAAAATAPAAAVAPPAVAPRAESAPVTRAEPTPAPTTRRAGELVIRPEAPPATPSAVDSPDLSFLKQGALAAILQRPMTYRIGASRDSIVVPAGFVAELASIPRSLWPELSPLGEHQRAAIVHDYLYWFQPCEREETDNILMIAMKSEGVSDLQRGAVYAGVRVGSSNAWTANAAARDRGELRIVPTEVGPTAQESWSDFRARLGKADIRGASGRMPRQSYCEYGKSQQVP
jgi:hypothetical protein